MTAPLLALLLLLGGSPPPPSDPVTDPDLQAGISMVRDGDFEAAVVRLDAAIRRLEPQPQRKAELARAYLYIGVAYLELEQELLARGKFRECLTRNREMRLSPREFSAQVIRVFESERQALGAPTAPKETATAKAVPRKGRADARAPPATAPPPDKEVSKAKGHGKAVLFVIGGGAAVAGTVLALGGGGEASSGSTTAPPTTPATTEPATTTTTTLTTSTVATTTTTTPQGCQYQLSPNNQSFPATGGTGSCQVGTSRGGCSWNAESTEGWIVLIPPSSGSGDGSVRFTVAPNPSGRRSGRIRLAQDHNERCEIIQEGALGAETAPARDLAWTSQLDVAGARGQVIVNGSVGTFHERGSSHGAAAVPSGPNRIEAQLVTAAGAPGTWSFQLSGTYRPGTLRVIAGDLLGMTRDAVVFRLAGRPGERLVFTFTAD